MRDSTCILKVGQGDLTLRKGTVQNFHPNYTNPNPNLNPKITVIYAVLYAVQLPNVLRK